MENLLLFLATGLVLRASGTSYKRYTICPGCSALLHSGSRTLHNRFTKDGDKISFNDHELNGVTYGLVCIQMKDDYPLAQAKDILVQYINKARRPLQIAYNVAMEVNNEKGGLSVTDYWQDEEGIDWKIKGYTNGKVIVLLYAKNITDAAVKNLDAYLNGFRFYSAS